MIGPRKTKCQSGTQRRELVEKDEIHALVDDTEEAEARSRQVALVVRVRRRAVAGLGEMGDVDGRREAVDRRVAVTLGLEQAPAAGEHEVRLGEKLALELQQIG